ncbi:MAG TPA: AbrB/MazE/SpoVT family DNA-binding domain-containing protein [Thermoanaerobaculia bacterium]|nr:AbrB/MazE/SpoVT family DNA-binding domain-containing protein [Thermoanaerobaculia bacterium]
MSKVTSKLQVTLPKALAERLGIRPGDEVWWEPAGDSLRLVPAIRRAGCSDSAERLQIFDQATARQQAREAGQPADPAGERGWRREDLYTRGGPR